MSTEPARPGAIEPALRNLVLVLVLGAIAPALDSTIVNIALDTLGRDLHASVTTTQWTLTGYLLATAMAMPMTAWASDRLGARRIWLIALAVFVTGSALAGLAWNIEALIVCRVVQGLAAGIMLPLVITLTVRASGAGRLGRAMAIATLPIAVVPIFGPVVGGVILSNLGWRWIFYVNVPICVAALVLAMRVVPADVATPDRRSLDVVGLSLLAPGLALVIYGLAQAGGSAGLTAATVVAPLIAGLLLCAAFAVHALRRPRWPLVNLRVLRDRSFAASAAVFLLSGLSLYGPMLVLALFYQQIEGHSPIVTGLLLAPQGIGSLLPRTIAGRLTDRIGPRSVVLTGLALTAVGTVAFAVAGPDPSAWVLALSLMVRGAGLGAATIAVMAGAFRGIGRADVPDASGTMRIVQQVGGSLGAAALSSILAAGIARSTAGAHAAAFGMTFWWAIGFTVLAMLPALALPGRRMAEAVAVPPTISDRPAAASA